MTTIDKMTYIIQATFQQDRCKVPKKHNFRTRTLDEVKAIRPGSRVLCLLNDKSVGEVTVTSVKMWKRDTTRVEVGIKYGMYEFAKLNSVEAMGKLVIHPVVCIA